jgi:hypothetical protein
VCRIPRCGRIRLDAVVVVGVRKVQAVVVTLAACGIHPIADWVVVRSEVKSCCCLDRVVVVDLLP